MKFTYPSWHRLHKQNDKEALTSAAAKSGLPPGSLVHIGERHTASCKIYVTQYNADKLEQQEIATLAELNNLPAHGVNTWINIDGLIDTKVVESIGRQFNIHPLVLEDILSTRQRPKLEEHEDYLYVVVKAINADCSEGFSLQYEQISILLLDHYVITFKEKADDTFKPIVNRLHNRKGRLRLCGCDYLTYVIIDTIVDDYFIVEDKLDDVIDPLEDSLLNNPTDNTLHTIQQLRRELIGMKRSISPLRELLTKIQHSDSALLAEKTLRFFNDVHDHVLRVTDALDSYRERIAAMQDIYLSSISHKMNETMKVLTIFASIFIPLTFIAGIYGMNFEYMPELKWRWGYPSLWMLFIIIGVALLLYFKKKKWL
ncbi:magnesium/cobalt transporter CorA [Methylomarinum sp. Ch1-1]|uniref:Magnesium transport protein CorA n=1 Tax=Methylomarinum roseum TaxID=3067653 RepID=A0AAU7P0C2_9GAMM|nr:magnesium/cobalt transporter CorA [Methylomarinum sp. Ch1-1]MDP4521657.1 magnesium/cobalt transporter CorA [Methylomarinum sp. Ch1-1]